MQTVLDRYESKKTTPYDRLTSRPVTSPNLPMVRSLASASEGPLGFVHSPYPKYSGSTLDEHGIPNSMSRSEAVVYSRMRGMTRANFGLPALIGHAEYGSFLVSVMVPRCADLHLEPDGKPHYCCGSYRQFSQSGFVDAIKSGGVKKVQYTNWWGNRASRWVTN